MGSAGGKLAREILRCKVGFWLRSNKTSLDDTMAEIGAWGILSGAGLLSIIIAIIAPPALEGAPGWAYMVLPIAMPVYAWHVARRRRSIASGREPPRDAVGP